MGGEEGNAEKQKRKVKKRQVLSTSEDDLIHTGNNDILSFVDQADSKRIKRMKRDASIASETLYLYHNGAYSKPLSRALTEIDSWLGSHRNEVVVIRLSNTDDNNHDISYQVSSREIQAFKHTGLNINRNPALGQAVQANKRVLLFLEQKKQIGYNDDRVHRIVKLDTTIKVHGDCAETTTLYARERMEKYNHHIIQVDWYHRLGDTCNLYLARLCNSREISRLQEVNSAQLRDYHHPINVILMDFVEVGDKGNQLNDEVLEINKKNVQLCKA
ncbi:uncharacterized protein LOC134825239 [Bolinopsis microptera]|uniref:uncharacterized protein LOC134825239 n=1 Tax=Bolinopsis microptera TaxID=2820187 RepID=UPI0030790CF0